MPNEFRPESNCGVDSAGEAVAELARLKHLRDIAPSLREMAEWCVAIEEAMGSRPPTRGLTSADADPVRRDPKRAAEPTIN